MKTFLDRVHKEKVDEIKLNQTQTSEKELREKVNQLSSGGVSPSSFSKALRRSSGQPISIIAEVKVRSPSGTPPDRENGASLDPIQVVHDYETGGAKAVSVLTDELHFGGSLETLEQVSQLTQLPLLHKEFIVSPYQLLQGRIRGASAALILVYYFKEVELKKIISQAKDIGVEAVVECSLPEELPRALNVNPDILLINNRPIAAIPADPGQTYQQGSVEVSVDWWEKSKDLRDWKSQKEKILISASCIDSPEHVGQLVALPYDAILVGNAAMTAPDRITFLKSLMVHS